MAQACKLVLHVHEVIPLRKRNHIWQKFFARNENNFMNSIADCSLTNIVCTSYLMLVSLFLNDFTVLARQVLVQISFSIRARSKRVTTFNVIFAHKLSVMFPCLILFRNSTLQLPHFLCNNNIPTHLESTRRQFICFGNLYAFSAWHFLYFKQMAFSILPFFLSSLCPQRT